MYKIAFIDLDGTLLSRGKKILKYDMKQLVKYAKSGGNIILSSGRWHISVMKFANKINSIVPNSVPFFASYNGSALWDVKESKFIHYNLIPSNMFKKSIDISNWFKVVALIYSGDGKSLYLNRFPLKFLFNRYLNGKTINAKHVKKYGHPISKIIYVSASKKKTNKLANFLIENFSEYYNICITHQRAIEVNAKYSNKGVIVDDVLKLTNISADESISFGDSFNDLPMFKKTCFSIGFNMKKAELLNNCSININQKSQFGYALKKYAFGFDIKSKNFFVDCSLINNSNLEEFSKLIKNAKLKWNKKIIFITNKDLDEMEEINRQTGSLADLIIHNGVFIDGNVSLKLPNIHVPKNKELIVYYTNSNKIYYETKMTNFDAEKFIRDNSFVKNKIISKVEFLKFIPKIASAEKYFFAIENGQYKLSYFDCVLHSKKINNEIKKILNRKKITPNDSTGFYTQLVSSKFPKEIFNMYINYNELLAHLFKKIK